MKNESDDELQLDEKTRRRLINQIAYRRATKHYEDERQALATELDAAEQYGRGRQLLRAWRSELSAR
jgi:hypothetical protein